ncbi:MAG TPA: hypothetical protein VKK79_20845 [Candidatus Lokiarchaeia archaeon]|nr:hypothetical protein [Candidatus Lokiarchaeia archaeon]
MPSLKSTCPAVKMRISTYTLTSVVATNVPDTQTAPQTPNSANPIQHTSLSLV